MTILTGTWLLGGACGATAAVGVLLVVAGLRRVPVEPAEPGWRGGPGRWQQLASRLAGKRRLLLAAAAAVVLGWVLTGWVVAGAAAGLAMVGAPRVRGGAAGRRQLARLETLEAWTRRLADLLGSGAGGLEQAIGASVRTCPPPIAAEVSALAGRLRVLGPEAALRGFADDLADIGSPAADLVAGPTGDRRRPRETPLERPGPHRRHRRRSHRDAGLRPRLPHPVRHPGRAGHARGHRRRIRWCHRAALAHHPPPRRHPLPPRSRIREPLEFRPLVSRPVGSRLAACGGGPSGIVVAVTAWAIGAGALVGLGVALLAAGLTPAAAPDLRAALARLDATPTGPQDRTSVAGWGPSSGGPPARPWWTRLGEWAAGRTPTAGPFAAPAADLRLLGFAPVSFAAAARTATAAAGLAFPAVLWAVTGVAGVPLPVALPAAVGVGLAAAGWLLPAAVLSQRAAQARAGLRVALSAYLDLVALERAAAGSPVEALEAAAEVGHGPAFTLIRGRLLLAARSGTSPYTALADLAEEIGVAELRDLADIAAIAADGAAVYATLLAKSRSLRNAIGADAQAAANAASERLVFPVVLLGTAFLLLVFYPALARLLTAG